MTSIQSSSLAAVGYLPEYRLMRVRFLSGESYDYPNTWPEKHAAFMAAPSKGQHLRLHFTAGTRLTDVEEAATEKAPAPRVVETFAEDGCCSKRLIKAKRDGLDSWTCPGCSCEWAWEMTDGIKVWSPVCHVVIW